MLFEHLQSLDYRVLRIANPFGPYQIAWKGQGFIAAAIARALSGQQIEIWGDGSVTRDFIFIDDVIDAFEAAARDTSDHRVFNIGTGEGRRLDDVLALIERILDVKMNIKRLPSRSLDTPISVLAIDRAREVLNWSPKTPFETGLARTIEWTRQSRPEIDSLFR